MIIRDHNYMVLSNQSNDVSAALQGLLHWDEEFYPSWAAIIAFHLFPQQTGQGVEPHYHDNDEFWLFTAGRGEVWLDGENFSCSPNTVVYTPKGSVQRFQMFTDGEIVALATRFEGQRRAGHLLVETDGHPEPSGSGLVLAGPQNLGSFPERDPHCPLSELRVISGDAEAPEEGLAFVNEYWLILSGTLHLAIGGFEVELARGDLAVLRKGVGRRLRFRESTRLALARE